MDEKIIKEGVATYYRNGVGGYLKLFSDKIIFKSHNFNIGKEYLEIYLEDILRVSCKGINILSIHLKNGKKEDFRVYGRTKWADAINQTVIEFNNDYNNSCYLDNRNKEIDDIENKGVPIEKVTFLEVYLKKFSWCAIIMAITAIFAIDFSKVDLLYVIVAMVMRGLIYGIPISLIISFISADYDKDLRPSKTRCPYCDNKLTIKYDHLTYKGIKSNCPNCSKELFVKDNYVYKYVEDMDKHFEDNNINNNNNNNSVINKNELDKYEEIKKLKELLDMGAITESEYEIKKQQLLK